MKYNFYILKIAFLLAVSIGLFHAMAMADQTDPNPVYIISSGDQLLITVLGHETELTALVVVRPDGMITYPVVGEVKAAGLTIAQLTTIIGEKLQLQGFYIDPQVTIQLKETIQILIYVFGAVMEPGQKKFPRSAGVIEVLASAGKPEESADLSKARIIKRGQAIPVNLEALLENYKMEQGVISHESLNDDKYLMEDGDVLIIPYASQINIIGNVNNPGRYYVKSPINPIQALALAGGSLEVADLKHVRIIRSDGTVDIVDAASEWSGGPKKDPNYSLLVLPDDSIVVPEKAKVRILGNVKNQGIFPVDGEISLIEALSLAGVDRDSNLKNLRIIRNSGEKITVDVSGIWRQGEEFIGENLNPGDTLIVPKAFRMNWTAISVSMAALSTLFALLSK